MYAYASIRRCARLVTHRVAVVEQQGVAAEQREREAEAEGGDDVEDRPAVDRSETRRKPDEAPP